MPAGAENKYGRLIRSRPTSPIPEHVRSINTTTTDFPFINDITSTSNPPSRSQSSFPQSQPLPPSQHSGKLSKHRPANIITSVTPSAFASSTSAARPVSSTSNDFDELTTTTIRPSSSAGLFTPRRSTSPSASAALMIPSPSKSSSIFRSSKLQKSNPAGVRLRGDSRSTGGGTSSANTTTKPGGGGNANAEEILHMIDPSYSGIASTSTSAYTYAYDADDHPDPSVPLPQSSTSYSFGDPSSSGGGVGGKVKKKKLVGRSSKRASTGTLTRPDLSKPYVDAQGTIHDPEFRTFDVSMAPHALASREQARRSQLGLDGVLASASGSSFFNSLLVPGTATSSHFPRSSASSYHTAFRERDREYSDDDGEQVEEEYARLEAEAALEEEEERKIIEEEERERERVRWAQLQRERRANRRRRNTNGELEGLVEDDGDGAVVDEEEDGFAGDGYDSDGDLTKMRTMGYSPRMHGMGWGRRRYSRTTDSGYAGTISSSSPPNVIVEQDQERESDRQRKIGEKPTIGVITPSPSSLPEVDGPVSGSVSTGTGAIVNGPTSRHPMLNIMRPSPSASAAPSRRSFTTPPLLLSGNTTPTTRAQHANYGYHQPMLRELSRSTLYPLPATNDAFHVVSGPAGIRSRSVLSMNLNASPPSPASSVSSGSSTAAAAAAKKSKTKKKRKSPDGTVVDGAVDGYGVGGRLMGLPDNVVLPDDKDNPFKPVVVEPSLLERGDDEEQKRHHHHLGHLPHPHLGRHKPKKGKVVDGDEVDVDGVLVSTPMRKGSAGIPSGALDPSLSTTATSAPTKKKKKSKTTDSTHNKQASTDLDEKLAQQHEPVLYDEPYTLIDGQDDLEKFAAATAGRRPRTPVPGGETGNGNGGNRPFISIVEASPPQQQQTRKSSSNIGNGRRSGDSTRVGGGSMLGVGGAYVPSQHGKTRSLRPGVDVIEDYTPGCADGLRRSWQSFKLSLRFGAFRTRKRIERRMHTVVG